MSAVGRFPAAYSLSAARLVSRKLDDRICTARPDTVARVGLLTVPCTVTARPGRATCGFTDVMPTVTCAAAVTAVREATVPDITVPDVTVPVGTPEVAAAAPLPARAGPAAISAAKAQASTPRPASPGHAGPAGLGSRCVGH